MRQEDPWVQSMGQEDSLEKEMAIHSSILPWRIPRTEKSNGLQSLESQKVRHDWATKAFTFFLFLYESHALKSLCPFNKKFQSTELPYLIVTKIIPVITTWIPLGPSWNRTPSCVLCLPLVCTKALVSQASPESQKPGSRINDWKHVVTKVVVGPGELVRV